MAPVDTLLTGPPIAVVRGLRLVEERRSRNNNCDTKLTWGR